MSKVCRNIPLCRNLVKYATEVEKLKQIQQNHENKENQSEGITEYNEKTKPIKGGRTLH